MTENINNVNNNDFNLLMKQFKQIVTNIIDNYKLTNFVDIEKTYNNFVNANQTLINNLDINDKQNFIYTLTNNFIHNTGLNISDQDILNFVKNAKTITNDNDVNNEIQVNKTNNNQVNLFNCNNYKTLNWFGKFRYFLYKFTSISANSGRFSVSMVTAMCYNIIILAMALSSLTPIIATIAHMSWTKHEIYLRNYYINKYWSFMFAFAWCFIIDWIIRLVYADFSNPYVSVKKAFRSYLLSISNLYQLISVIAVISLLFVYGKSWGINLSKETNNVPKQLATILFLLNVAVIIPRFAENFFFGKNLILFKNALKSKWKILLGAGIILIILLLIFAFTIYETESSYYIQQGWLDQTTGVYDMNAFTHGSPFQTIWEALWYSFITITTIGYGDYVPYSEGGKIIAVFLSVVGISYFTFIMGILVNVFTDYSSAKKTEENKLKESQSKNNQFKQFNYLYDLIINDFSKLGIIDKEKLNAIKSEQNQQITNASDVLDAIEINNHGNLIWNKQKLGIRIYNIKDIKPIKDIRYVPTIDEALSTNIIYSFDDIYLRRILRYKHFSVLLTKIVGNTNIKNIFICKEHYNREVYASLMVGISIIMPKDLAYETYGSFSQFENKLQFDSYFKEDDCVQISLITNIYPFLKINRLSQYGLDPKQFVTYSFLIQDNNNVID